MSDLAAFDFGDEFGRTLGQLLHGAIEGGPIAGGDHFGEFVHEFKRARSKLFVDRAASGRQRQKRFAQISAISAAAEKSALLELRHRARDLGLVHMSVRAHRLAGHHAVLAEGDQDPPFRYSNTVTAVDAGERLRHQAGEDVEPVGQKVFELEQRRLSTRLVGRRGGVRRAVTDWTGVRHEPRPEAGAVGSSLDRCGEHWRKMASRATEPSSRRSQGALVRLALAPTRCSCVMHCKEQAGNNGIGPAMVFYSRRLVRRGAGGLRDFPPSPVSNSMVRLSLWSSRKHASRARVRATKNPLQNPARAGWRKFGEYAFLEDSRYTSQQENMQGQAAYVLATGGVAAAARRRVSAGTRWRQTRRARTCRWSSAPRRRSPRARSCGSRPLPRSRGTCNRRWPWPRRSLRRWRDSGRRRSRRNCWRR